MIQTLFYLTIAAVMLIRAVQLWQAVRPRRLTLRQIALSRLALDRALQGVNSGS